MRSIIIDDEPKNVRILHKLLTDYCADVNIIGTAGDAIEAYEIITDLKPDLVFLDIEIPNGNAFDLLDKLMPITFEIIFITAFESYSLKAFKYSALDYLLKPVSIDDLQNAVLKAQNRTISKNINLQISSLLHNLKTPINEKKKIALETLEGFELIREDDIIRLEAKGNYTEIHLRNKLKILASKNIKEYEEILNDQLFFRVHNSHIVNLNFIKKYYKGRGGYIILEDETTIEIATRRKIEFLSRFK